MDLEVRHLRLVSTIADCGSLTRAGELLHLTQSALSHQLRDIEGRLGTKLFDRLNRRMVATPAGLRLIDSARTVLAELTVAEEEIRRGLRPVPRRLRISTECYTCYHWLPPVIRKLRERDPSIEIEIDTDATTTPVSALQAGTLDVAFMYSPVRQRGLISRLILEDEMMLLVHADHPLAARPFVRLSDFRQLRLFTYSPRKESYFVNITLRRAGVAPEAVQPVRITEAVVELVRAGLGAAVLANWAVKQYVERSTDLRAIRITAKGLPRRWNAVYPKRHEGLPHLESFLTLVAANGPKDTVSPLRPVARTKVG
jgi:LysR family transcriptional regulator for metE and metH